MRNLHGAASRVHYRPVARISERWVQLNSVGDHHSGGSPPDPDNNLIFDVL